MSTDLTETLAATLRKWRLRHAEGWNIFWSDQAALLSAVQNVLALCDGKPYFTGFGTDGETIHGVLVADVRKALTGALEGGAEC